MADAGEQDQPVMSGSTAAGDDEKADGIIEQTAVDLAGHDVEEVLAALAQRFDDSGVEYDDERLRAAAQKIADTETS